MRCAADSARIAKLCRLGGGLCDVAARRSFASIDACARCFWAAKPVIAYQAGETQPDRMTDARARVFAALQEMGGMSAPDLARAAQVSSSVVKGLIESGHLAPYELPGHQPFPAPDADYAPRAFSEEQEEVVVLLRDAVAAHDFARIY